MDLVSASSEKLEPLPRDPSQSVPAPFDDAAWLEDITEKSKRGVTEAQFALGQYLFAKGKYHEAWQQFELAAHRDNMQAKYQLGVMLYDGKGVMEDASKGFDLMMEVAESSKRVDAHLVPSAQYNIGRAFFQGFGVRQSDEEAVKWWSRSAEKGKDPSSVRAQNTLGMYFSRNENVNLKESFRWHSAAAENGHIESMAALGIMLINGRGCVKDEEQGIQWLRTSATRGSIYGTGALAHQYYARKMFTKAVECAFKASENTTSPLSLSPLECRGIALCCFVLARCLELGLAVAKNVPKAQEYYLKSRDYDKAMTAELHTLLIYGRM